MSQQTASLLSHANPQTSERKIFATKNLTAGDLILIDHACAGDAWTVFYGIKYDYDICLKLFPREDDDNIDAMMVKKICNSGFCTQMHNFVVGNIIPFAAHSEQPNAAVIIVSKSSESKEMEDESDEEEEDEEEDEEDEEEESNEEDEGPDVIMDDQCFVIVVATRPIRDGEEITINYGGGNITVDHAAALEQAEEAIMRYLTSTDFEERSANMDYACVSGKELEYNSGQEMPCASAVMKPSKTIFSLIPEQQ